MSGLSVMGLLVLQCGSTPLACVSEPFTAEPVATRSFHEIHTDMRSALQHEAKATAAADWASTVVHLTEIYRELMRDSRLATSDTLISYRVKLRSRLLGIQRDLERDLTRAKKTRAKKMRVATADQQPPGLEIAGLKIAGQQMERQVSEHLAMVLSLSGDSLGGPSTVYKYGGDILGARGGAARGDYGLALVELIRRTISPDSWDVNGGPGTIVYYRPWFALVVRARSEVHHQIGGLLGGSR
jgi:hypothetical protein